MKTLQKPFDVVWGHDIMNHSMTLDVVSSKGGPFSFFSKGGCDSKQTDGCFHVLFSAFSCGLASTVMCPIIPLYKQFFKSSRGSLTAVCFYISANLVPLYVNWCTYLICILIVNMFKCFLVCVFFIKNVTCLCHREQEGEEIWMKWQRKQKRAFS